MLQCCKQQSICKYQLYSLQGGIKKGHVVFRPFSFEQFGIYDGHFGKLRKNICENCRVVLCFCYLCTENLIDMDNISSMQIPVCKVFANNGFQIEYMPDFLDDKEFDNHSPHVHSFYEILWFREGAGHHTVDFIDYEVKTNTIFFLAPGQIHHFDHNSYKGVSMKICSDFLKGDGCHGDSFLKFNVFYQFESTPCLHIDDATAGELDVLVSLIEKEYMLKNEFGNADMLHSLIRMFLIQAYRHGIKNGQLRLDALKPSHQLFVRFRSLVENEYQHIHSVQDYARSLNTNVRTLNKCVNECSGMSPLAFIDGRIVLEAKRLVRYSNLRIKEVAFMLGYDDPSYFVRLFKRHTGFMPTEFREMD